MRKKKEKKNVHQANLEASNTLERGTWFGCCCSVWVVWYLCYQNLHIFVLLLSCWFPHRRGFKSFSFEGFTLMAFHGPLFSGMKITTWPVSTCIVPITSPLSASMCINIYIHIYFFFWSYLDQNPMEVTPSDSITPSLGHLFLPVIPLFLSLSLSFMQISTLLKRKKERKNGEKKKIKPKKICTCSEDFGSLDSA